jgi:hypothetical protein
MQKNIFLMGLIVLVVILSFAVSPAPAQQDLEKQFLEKHQKEMAAFMDKCSACHSLQRVFAKKRTKEEWHKILDQMAGKPHAMISQDDKQRIQNWIDLMTSTLQVGP